MVNTTVSAQAHAASFTSKYRTIALVVICVGFIMDLLDNTIVNIAIPSIQADLGASYSTIQWLVAGYSLAFALLLVTGGRMGDVFGYKKIFMIGVGGFTLASLLSGLAWTPLVLILTRLLQGAMAALMVPQVISVMQIMYKPEERAGINGLFGGLAGVAASLGPIIGGLLIKADIFNLEWRPIFLINVPVGIIGLIAAAKYLPNGKSEHPLKLDGFGTGLLLVTLFLLVFPLIQGRDLGWPAWTYLMMALSIPSLLLFMYWQRVKDRRDGSALIVPALFKKRSFSLGMVVNIIFEGAMLSFFLTFTLLIQGGLGYGVLHAALTGLPLAFGIALTMALLGEKVVPKIGSYAMTLGTIIMSGGLLLTSAVVHHYGLAMHSWQFIPGLLIIGFGMGLVFASLFGVVLNDVDVTHAGSASGTLNAVQQVGGAIGVALIGVIFFGQLQHAAGTSFSKVEPQLQAQLAAAHVPAEQTTAISNGIRQCFVDRSAEKDTSVVPASCKQSGGDAKLTNIITKASLSANQKNFDNAFHKGVLFEVGLLAVVCITSLFLPKKIKAGVGEI